MALEEVFNHQAAFLHPGDKEAVTRMNVHVLTVSFTNGSSISSIIDELYSAYNTSLPTFAFLSVPSSSKSSRL